MASINFHDVQTVTFTSFKIIKCNLHCRYDNTTGIFTADRNGLYYLYFYLEVDDDLSPTYGFLYKNGILQCFAEGGGLVDEEFMISCGAVMQLVPGDEVYVETDDANAFENPDSCGFTGFLI